MSARPYWNELAGLRTLSFLTVFFYHYGPPPVSPGTTWGSIVLLVFDKLFVGVDIFFVLSGFLITALLLDERRRTGDISLRQFYARRTLRIFPLYYAVLALAAVAPLFAIEQTQWSSLWYYYKKILLPSVFFFANFAFIKHHHLLDQITDLFKLRLSALLLPLWSLCVEEHYYLFWAPTFKRLKKSSLLKWCCLLAIAISVAFKTYFWHVSSLVTTDWASFYTWFYNSLCRMDGLMVGSLSAILMFGRGEDLNRFFAGWKIPIAASIGAFILWMVFCVPRLIINPPIFVVAQAMLPWFIASGLLLTISTPRLKSMLSLPALTTLAKYTYSGYLVHYFILQTVVEELHKHAELNSTPMGYVVGLVAALSLTLIIAHLSWVFLEKNLAKWRTKFAA